MNEKVNARIQALEAELLGLKKDLAEPKKEGRFRAELGGVYYFISETFNVISTQEKNTYLDDGRYYKHNYFKTKAEAESIAEKTKLMFDMTARVKELNGDWMADWGNGQQSKWGIKLHSNKCTIDWFNESNPFIFSLSVQSKKHAEILLKEFKERIERWY